MCGVFSILQKGGSRCFRIALVSLLLATANPPRVFAGPDGRTPEERYADGLVLAQHGKLQEAITVWLEIADELQSDEDRREVQSSLGFAFYGLGRLEPAWYYFDRYIRSGATRDVEAVQAFQAIEKKLVTTHFRVELLCSPANASVAFLDSGSPPRRCPFSWWFLPGEHTFLGSSEGYKSRKTSFVMPASGGVLVHKIVLHQETGTLLVEGTDLGGDVFLDGESLGSAPVSRSLPVGLYVVEIRKKGDVAWKSLVRIRDSAETIVSIVLPPSAPTLLLEPVETLSDSIPQATGDKDKTLAWSLAGGGLAAALLGGGLVLLAANKAGDVSTGNDEEYNREVLPYEIPGWTLLGLGAGALVTGTAILLLGAEEDHEVRKK